MSLDVILTFFLLFFFWKYLHVCHDTGLQDAVHAGDVNAASVGRRIILPSSYVGGPRYMHQRYQDAMAIVRSLSPPDYFITFTCNPKWPEITAELFPNQTAADRPDLTDRVFHIKLQELLDDLLKMEVLGTPHGMIHVIEFQKRGLPHAHILLIMSSWTQASEPFGLRWVHLSWDSWPRAPTRLPMRLSRTPWYMAHVEQRILLLHAWWMVCVLKAIPSHSVKPLLMDPMATLNINVATMAGHSSLMAENDFVIDNRGLSLITFTWLQSMVLISMLRAVPQLLPQSSIYSSISTRAMIELLLLWNNLFQVEFKVVIQLCQMSMRSWTSLMVAMSLHLSLLGVFTDSLAQCLSICHPASHASSWPVHARLSRGWTNRRPSGESRTGIQFSDCILQL